MPFIDYVQINDDEVTTITHMQQIPCCQRFPEYSSKLEIMINKEFLHSGFSDEDTEMVLKMIPLDKAKIDQFIELVRLLFKVGSTTESVGVAPVRGLYKEFTALLNAENLKKIMQYYSSHIPFIMEELRSLKMPKMHGSQKHFDELLLFIDDQQRAKGLVASTVSAELEKKQSFSVVSIDRSLAAITFGVGLEKQDLTTLPLMPSLTSNYKELCQLEEKASMLEFNSPEMLALFYRFPKFTDNLRDLGRYLYIKLGGNWQAVCDVFTELNKIEIHLAEAVGFLYRLGNEGYIKKPVPDYYIDEGHLKACLETIIKWQKNLHNISLQYARTNYLRENGSVYSEFLQSTAIALEKDALDLFETQSPTAADYMEEALRLDQQLRSRVASEKPVEPAFNSILSVFLVSDASPSEEKAKSLSEKDICSASIFSCQAVIEKTLLARNPKECLEEEQGQESAYSPGKPQRMI